MGKRFSQFHPEIPPRWLFFRYDLVRSVCTSFTPVVVYPTPGYQNVYIMNTKIVYTCSLLLSRKQPAAIPQSMFHLQTQVRSFCRDAASRQCLMTPLPMELLLRPSDKNNKTIPYLGIVLRGVGVDICETSERV